jgi:hypothetical protein
LHSFGSRENAFKGGRPKERLSKNLREGVYRDAVGVALYVHAGKLCHVKLRSWR